MEDKISQLALSLIPGIGAVRLKKLLSHFTSIVEMQKELTFKLAKSLSLPEKTFKNLKNFSFFKEKAMSVLEYCKKEGIKIIFPQEPSFPSLLKKIYDPPLVIYIKGEYLDKDTQAIAIVGTRSPDPYGQTVTAIFTRELAMNGFTIISGLARGIDTIAHKEALKAGGRTIAVIGSGLDYIYPPENKELTKSIVESGAVISEFPPGTPPMRENFPRRNRLISGLSRGVLITQAPRRSGALITALLALEQGKEVFAVPGPIKNFRSCGTHYLIKQGAKLSETLEDLLEELAPHTLPKQLEIKSSAEMPTQLEKQVLEVLGTQPLHFEELLSLVSMETAKLCSLLVSLELKGLVKRFPGNYYIKQL